MHHIEKGPYMLRMSLAPMLHCLIATGLCLQQAEVTHLGQFLCQVSLQPVPSSVLLGHLCPIRSNVLGSFVSIPSWQYKCHTAYQLTSSNNKQPASEKLRTLRRNKCLADINLSCP